MCANRIFVQDGIYDEFSQKLAQAVEKFVVGDGFEAGVTQGPLINEAAVQKVVITVISKPSVIASHISL